MRHGPRTVAQMLSSPSAAALALPRGAPMVMITADAPAVLTIEVMVIAVTFTSTAAVEMYLPDQCDHTAAAAVIAGGG